eukprot:s1452_g4.t1
MNFLEGDLDRPWRLDEEGVQHTMLTAIIEYNAFHRCCWKAEDRRWLSREEAAKAACCLDAFISCYALLARWAFRNSMCHYVLVPKLHFLKHLVLDMQKELANPAARHIANPALFATTDGEDFVGRISRPVRETAKPIINDSLNMVVPASLRYETVVTTQATDFRLLVSVFVAGIEPNLSQTDTHMTST